MFDKADNELIKRLIEEAEVIIEEEIQKRLYQENNAVSTKNQKEVTHTDNSDDAQESVPKKSRKRTKKSNDASSESVDGLAAESSDQDPPKRRRGRPRKVVKPEVVDDEADSADANLPSSTANKKPIAKSLIKERVDGEMMIKEAILEFVEREDGVLTLQEVGNEDEPMVTIHFSEQVKAMIGKDEIQNVGQNMIHAAIATVMQRQMDSWHAHIYDEQPTHYS
ncbi:hypothetical protein MBO_01645 [Moraxella bovoculi 237]|uniref:Uncharacterized protein n=1 Tax=Moraxella bovoculi 237 TaxID=743974 RepID=A0A066UJ04_9GAMM|nr:hypothetical protein [Moraxella bovoculi]KDN25857.1 hypothetical protein MBO_01645 [Moraxella bovoculi 237]